MTAQTDQELDRQDSEWHPAHPVRKPAPCRVYIDIETATQSRVLQRELVKIAPGLRHPHELVEWMNEHAADEATNPIGGRVISWALATSDDREWCFVDQANDGDDEVGLLTLLLQLLRELRPVMIAAHHGAGFDFPFLRARALACRLPELARIFWSEKPWDERLVDTSVATWAPRPTRPEKGWGYSLDTLAELLGIERPSTIPGADVPAAWYRKEFSRIREHNLDDVRTLRDVTRRLAEGRS